MVEQKTKKKKIRGLGGIVAKQMEPLETNEIFIKKYGTLKMKVLLNAVDSKYAAVVSFDEGKIDIEGIKNTDKKALKKKVLGWNAKLATKTEIFLNLAMGKVGLGKIGRYVITRKLKIKGVKNLLKLMDMFAILAKEE